MNNLIKKLGISSIGLSLASPMISTTSVLAATNTPKSNISKANNINKQDSEHVYYD